MEGANGAVDGNFREVGSSQPVPLGIAVRENAALEQRIIGKINARHDIGGAEGCLFRFRKKVVRVAVQHHFPDDFHGNQCFRNELGSVQNIEVELVCVLFRDELQPQLVFRIISGFNGLPEILAVEVRIASCQYLGFIPHQGFFPVQRFPVETDESAFSIFIDQFVRMNAEPFHRTEASGDAAVRHGPHDVVQSFRLQGDEVPEGVMGRLPLRHFIVGFRFDGMDEIRKFDGILNEEDGRVIAYQIIVAFLGIEFGSPTADIPYCNRRSSEALHGGKTHKDRGFFSRILQKSRFGVLGKGFVHLKITMCPGTSCVNHAFRYPLLVKMSHFLQKVEVFKQRGASASCFKCVLIIGYFNSQVACEGLSHAVGAHGIQLPDFFRSVIRHLHGTGRGRFRIGRRRFWSGFDQFRINCIRIMGSSFFSVGKRGGAVFHGRFLFFHWLIHEGSDFSMWVIVRLPFFRVCSVLFCHQYFSGADEKFL